MSVLKLQNEGDTHTAEVAGAEPTKGQYGMQAKFSFTDGHDLYLPLESAERQLERCGFAGEYDADGKALIDWDRLTGETLTFSRSKNPKPGAKPYWNVEVATKADAKPKGASKRMPSPSSAPQKPEVPADGPPAFFADVPLPESPVGVPDKVGFTEGATAKELAYYALATRVAAFQQKISEAYEAPFDLASVNAMSFSIFNQR